VWKVAVPRLSSRQRYLAVFGGIALIIAGGIAGSVLTGAHDRATLSSGTIPVEAGTETCGQGWGASAAGDHTFALHNTTIATEEIYLEGRDGRIYGELEALGPASTHELSARLSAGSYRFVCLAEDLPTVRGPLATVTGPTRLAGATPGLRVVTGADLIAPTKTYHDWVAGRLPVLSSDVTILAAAVHTGDRVAAEAAWLTAHEEYESLGAAYGAFGDMDGAINGGPASGDTALSDPDLTGFHRIEAQLWSGVALTDVVPAADRLVDDIAQLQQDFGTSRIPFLDVGLRSHEILENAVQFELTGRTDAGSHSSLATVAANLVGTRAALAPLQSLLTSRYPQLPETMSWLDRADAVVADYHNPDGSWVPLTDLSTAGRETLNATIDHTVELLANVAAITDPRISPDAH